MGIQSDREEAREHGRNLCIPQLQAEVKDKCVVWIAMDSQNFSQAIQTGEKLPNRRYGKSSGPCRKESRSPCWSGVRAYIRNFQHHNRKWNRSGN
jgi:hypothetical protein